MGIINELIRTESDGSISFGNYELESKSKVDGFEHEGKTFKVKTCNEITRLECNDLFVYESVPGSAVTNLQKNNDGMEFNVCGFRDCDITLGLDEKTEYEVLVNNKAEGKQNTGLGGKITLSLPLDDGNEYHVKIKKI